MTSQKKKQRTTVLEGKVKATHSIVGNGGRGR